MNEMLIKNYNDIVTQEDVVYFLGDFSMAFRSVELYSNRLNGKKYVIPGNHCFGIHSYHKKGRDPKNRAIWKAKWESHGWTVLPEQTTLDVPGVANFNLCHMPYGDENSRGGYEDDGHGDKYAKWRPVDDGRILLHGHTHGKWLTKRSSRGTLMIDCGVDANNFKPVSIDQIAALIAKENSNVK